MRQILMALAVMVIMASSAGANEIGVVLQDSISAADTVEGATRVDTAYTAVTQIYGGGLLQFHSYVNQLIGPAAANYALGTPTGAIGGSGGGDQTSDSLLMFVQHSFDGKTDDDGGPHWTSIVIDTLFGTMVDTNSASTIVIDLNSAVYGEYWRMMYIHRDFVGEEVQDSLGNINYFDCKTWLIERVE